jgi:hypothetical protein
MATSPSHKRSHSLDEEPNKTACIEPEFLLCVFCSAPAPNKNQTDRVYDVRSSSQKPDVYICEACSKVADFGCPLCEEAFKGQDVLVYLDGVIDHDPKDPTKTVVDTDKAGYYHLDCLTEEFEGGHCPECRATTFSSGIAKARFCETHHCSSCHRREICDCDACDTCGYNVCRCAAIAVKREAKRAARLAARLAVAPPRKPKWDPSLTDEEIVESLFQQAKAKIAAFHVEQNKNTA